MCGLSAFLLYTHTQNPGTCIRGTPVPGLGAATPGRVILTLRAPPREQHIAIRTMVKTQDMEKKRNFLCDQQYYKQAGKRALTLRTFFKIVWAPDGVLN